MSKPTYNFNDRESFETYDERLKDWRREHWCQATIEDVYDFFRYTIPRKYDDAFYGIKWAYQRVARGYDDRMLWGFHTENSKITLEVLKWMKEHKHGSPYTHDPEGVLTTPDTPTDSSGVNDDWHKRWDEALTIMIEGWEALIAMDDVFIYVDGKYDSAATTAEYERLEKIWKKGMTLFVANYRGLWD